MGAKFTPPPPTLGKIIFFCRVLGRSSIVLEFLRLFAKSSGELLPKKKSEQSYPPTFQKFKFFLHYLLVKEEF